MNNATDLDPLFYFAIIYNMPSKYKLTASGVKVRCFYTEAGNLRQKLKLMIKAAKIFLELATPPFFLSKL